MLNLQPGIDFQKGKLTRLVEQEFDGARVGVARRARQSQGSLAHACPQIRVDRRRRALFDQLLMPALDAAVAFAEVNQVAVVVSEDLDLDVARSWHVALEEHAVVAEGS